MPIARDMPNFSSLPKVPQPINAIINNSYDGRYMNPGPPGNQPINSAVLSQTGTQSSRPIGLYVGVGVAVVVLVLLLIAVVCYVYKRQSATSALSPEPSTPVIPPRSSSTEGAKDLIIQTRDSSRKPLKSSLWPFTHEPRVQVVEEGGGIRRLDTVASTMSIPSGIVVIGDARAGKTGITFSNRILRMTSVKAVIE